MAPKPTAAQVAMRTQMATYFTKDSGTHLWFAPMGPTKVTLVLEDAGPVAIGLADTLHPATSGKGFLLPTDVPLEFTLNRGDRLFITADTKNRVAYIFSPIL